VGSDLKWLQSSYCESATCVEVATDGKMIAVRNSQAPADVLWFTPDEWRAFTEGCVAGDFYPENMS